jgi:hypothetical protein
MAGILCRSTSAAHDLDLMLVVRHGGEHGSELLLSGNLLSDLHRGTSESALVSSHAHRHRHHLCLPPQIRGKNSMFDGRLILPPWCRRAFGALLEWLWSSRTCSAWSISSASRKRALKYLAKVCSACFQPPFGGPSSTHVLRALPGRRQVVSSHASSMSAARCILCSTVGKRID